MPRLSHCLAVIGLLAGTAAALAEDGGASQSASAPAHDWNGIIKGLSSDNFAEREAAQRELDKVPEEEIDAVRLLAQSQKDEEVKARLQTRVAQMQATMDNYFSSGDAKNAAGDWKGAISDYTKGLKRQPTYFLAYLGRANARDDSGDFAGALADYTRAIELNPQFGPSYMNRGLAKSRQGDVDGALADYDKAVGLSPNDADVYFYRAMTRQKKNDLDGGIADYTRSLQLRPAQVDGYFYRGVLKQMKGDDDGALKDFAATIGRNPARGDAHYYLAAIEYDRQAWAPAAVNFRDELAVNASSESARAGLWLARVRQGEQAAATKELQEYLDGRKDTKGGGWSLNICKYLAGRLNEQDFLKAAANADKTKDGQQHCEAYFYLGSVRLLAGDKTAAAADFEKSVATGMLISCYHSAQAELKRLKSGDPVGEKGP